MTSCVGKCGKKKSTSEIAVHPAPDAKKSYDDDNDEIEKKKLLPKDDEAQDDEAEAQLEKGDDDVIDEEDEEDEDEDEDPMDMSWPTKAAVEHSKCPCCRLFVARILYIVLFPLKGLFFITVPDVRREDSEC